MERRSFKISPDLIQNYLYGKKKVLGRAGSEYCAESFESKHTEEMLKNNHHILPEQVEIARSSIPCERLGIFSTMWIKDGTQMGPFSGRVIKAKNIKTEDLNDYCWEIFDDYGQVTHFIDGTDELKKNWLCYVRCARFDQEQNLETIHIDDNIYYRAIKDIPPHQELLVWYGNTISQFLGIPISKSTREEGLKTKTEKRAILNRIIRSNKVALLPGRLRCTVCRRGFNSRSNLRSHMRIHTLEKPFECKFCKKAFSQSSTLRNHTRLHTGEKPYVCTVCNMAYSQLAGLRAHQKSARHRPSGGMIMHEFDGPSKEKKTSFLKYPYSFAQRAPRMDKEWANQNN